MILSIILPVYNVSAYLGDCLDSLLTREAGAEAQMEVIAVNDGSTDNCAEILLQYARQHPNLTVVSQKNQGLSAARMKGLSYAIGTYVWFVDSDDWLESGAVDFLFNTIRQEPDIDVFVSPLKWTDDAGSVQRIDLEGVPRGEFLARDYLKNGFQAVGAPHFVVRREVLSYPQIYFPLGLLHEDAYFGRVLLYLAKQVYVINRPLYNYRVRPGSIMTARNIQSSYDLVSIYRMLDAFCEQTVEFTDKEWYRRRIVEGTLLESYNINTALIGTPPFSQFLRKNRGRIIRAYLRCGAKRSFARRVGDIAYMLSPAVYKLLRGEYRYISLHEPR